MATFYIQLENKLLQISGDLTAENISKALGYVPVDSSTMNNYATKDEVSDLVDMSMVEELSQRVDNITFDSLKDNPFLQDGSGELNIVDEAGNIIAKVNAEGIHSVDFIAGTHKLTDKIDLSALNGYAKESWVTAEITKAAAEGKVDLTGYATEEWVENKNYLTKHQDISHLANKDEIPTKVSDLENDSNYLTEHQDISHLATKQEVSNIDFYNINNNPIVNNGDGKLLFVDENGYIGLQLEEDGLYVKDVIADGHTLSQKANKSDIPSLDGYATESYVNTNLQNYATKDEVSDLVDMSVVTELQGKVDTLVGEDADKSVRDIAVDVLTETLVSETATEAYDTLAEMSAWIKSHPEDAAAMSTAIQKNATDIQSNTTAISNLDAAYKAADTKVLTDAQEYADNINFFTIKNNPIVDNNDGNLIFVDETGNIGLQFSNNAILVNDVITPEHTLSSKQNVLISGTNIKTVNGESILGSGDITIEVGTTLTEADIVAMGFTKNTGTYSKPSGGIPKTDLASAVQTSLGKADTALQSYTEQYKGTITGVSANGTSVATSGVANIPAASTSVYGVTKLSSATNSTSTTLAATASAVKSAYDLANGKQDKLVSGTNIKTVNGTSILGSGDITISGGSSDANVQAVDTGDVLDDVTVDYATTAYVDNKVANISLTNYATITYVDGLFGDINSVLESIINGGGPVLITFTVNGKECQAEEGMTFYEWAISDYYNENTHMRSFSNTTISLREFCINNGDTGDAICTDSGLPYTPSIATSTIIQDGCEYNVNIPGGFPM